MSIGPETEPLRIVRAVPVARQFVVVGGIHSFGIAVFVGFFALVALKLGADFANGASGDVNLPFALAWAAMAFGVAFLTLWTLHYWKLVVQRDRTSYVILPDRVEVRRVGRDRPTSTIPLDRTVAVQSWTGPFLRPHGLATLTLIVEEPPGPSGHSRHVFHPLTNVPDPEAVADLIRSRIAAGASAGSSA
ncbi:PH domain-containing protein [Paludisphaera mucosa]|uniref:PH domain-containing protein n=1 Tax=Paludisphaera mucosa TaxID=3030827 RepID=A0ABT6FK94_9BACT|nr:PH domain-containing protein [Paludisphaera mucosa]MDG3007959.1 PH domain-containing protein [Paludisphaera mucosa]